jgi:hypothetical protein
VAWTIGVHADGREHGELTTVQWVHWTSGRVPQAKNENYESIVEIIQKLTNLIKWIFENKFKLMTVILMVYLVVTIESGVILETIGGVGVKGTPS